MNKDLVNGIAIGAGGWVVAIVTLAIGYVERKSAREESRLAKTLDYFDGGSQRRSIGISMLEGVWLNKPKYHPILVPLVANQIVYLLLSTDSHDAHNERNLVRLIEMFTAIPNLQTHYHDRWGDVCDALHTKYNWKSKGIPIGGPTLKLWARSLGYEMVDEAVVDESGDDAIRRDETRRNET
jgi:hypothetical protein